VALYIADCRRMGIPILPPEVNRSGLDFEIDDTAEGTPSIRFGLGAVKNVGEGAVEVVLKARAEHGPFASLEDFARRVDLRHVGKRALESLARVGALDVLGGRAALLEALDQILSLSQGHFRAAEIGQLTLFGGGTAAGDSLTLPGPLELPRRQMLAWEKELLGVYASDHPLTPFIERLTGIVTHFSAELREAENGQPVRVGGEVTHVRPYLTKSGKSMGFVTLEDLQGSIELVVFARRWERVCTWIQPGQIVVTSGKVDSERGDPKVLVDDVAELESPGASVIALGEASRRAAASPARVAGRRSAPGDPTAGGDSERASQVVPAPPVDVEANDDDPPAVPVPVEAMGDRLPLASAALPLEPGLAGRRMITVIMRTTGDRDRDARRMRRVHGLLNSYPGGDLFLFDVYESSRRYSLEFPNSTTGFCVALKDQLEELLGSGSVHVRAAGS
jgi:DNA polymerase-3 subunit alpha